MQTDQRPDQVDVAARAWMASLASFAATQPDGFHRAGPHGTSELVTGAPMPLLNGVIGIGRLADPAEVAAFAASARLRSVPWSIQVRGERVDDAILGTAAEHGLVRRSTLPFMIKDLVPADASLPDAEPWRVRRIAGDESGPYQRALAAGYEGPVELFGVFSGPAVLDHPAMSAYLVEAGGAPVATSFGVRVDDLVGVFNIAVPPEHRRRGYGRAATAAVLREAYASGARTAFLHASAMGVPLYRAMGFRLAENWTILAP